MTPLEKAARAAFNADENRAGEYDHRSERVKDNYRAIARAVLLAIREPSEGMVEVGESQGPWDYYAAPDGKENALDVYQAMIDKALEEG